MPTSKLPEAVVAKIMDQSECRPGLAATLAEPAGVPSVASRLADGQLLLDHVRQSCTRRGLTGVPLFIPRSMAQLSAIQIVRSVKFINPLHHLACQPGHMGQSQISQYQRRQRQPPIWPHRL